MGIEQRESPLAESLTDNINLLTGLMFSPDNELDVLYLGKSHIQRIEFCVEKVNKYKTYRIKFKYGRNHADYMIDLWHPAPMVTTLLTPQGNNKVIQYAIPLLRMLPEIHYGEVNNPDLRVTVSANEAVALIRLMGIRPVKIALPGVSTVWSKNLAYREQEKQLDKRKGI